MNYSNIALPAGLSCIRLTNNEPRHNTGIFIIPWHISQYQHILMAERAKTCDPHIERETLQVYLHMQGGGP